METKEREQQGERIDRLEDELYHLGRQASKLLEEMNSSSKPIRNSEI